MPQPVDIPDWAPDEGDVVEPSGAKKSIGWLTSERPPAQFFNWFWKRASQWFAYLQNLDSEDFAWTGNHQFEAPTEFFDDVNSRTSLDLGADKLGTDADADLPRITAGGYSTGFAKKTLMLEIGSETRRLRIYFVAGGPGIQITSNAYWTNSTGAWLKDDNAQGAFMMWVSLGQFSLNHKIDGEDSAWDDTADSPTGWSNTFLDWDVFTDLVRIDSLAVSSLTSQGTQIPVQQEIDLDAVALPLKNSARKDRVTPINLVKLWAQFSNSVDVVTYVDGFNCENVTKVGGADKIRVAFPVSGLGDMVDTNYSVFVTTHNIVTGGINITSKAADAIEFEILNTSGTPIDFTSIAFAASVMIIGRQ